MIKALAKACLDWVLMLFDWYARAEGISSGSTRPPSKQRGRSLPQKWWLVLYFVLVRQPWYRKTDYKCISSLNRKTRTSRTMNHNFRRIRLQEMSKTDRIPYNVISPKCGSIGWKAVDMETGAKDQNINGSGCISSRLLSTTWAMNLAFCEPSKPLITVLSGQSTIRNLTSTSTTWLSSPSMT